MNRSFLIAVGGLLLASQAIAQDSPKIVGQVEAKPGELVILQPPAIPNARTAWWLGDYSEPYLIQKQTGRLLIAQTGTFETVEISANSLLIYAQKKPGRQTFALLIIPDDKNQPIDWIRHTIEVRGPPAGDDPVGEDPPPIDGDDLTKSPLYSAVLGQIRISPQITQEQRAKVVPVFEGLATDAASGKFDSKEDLWDASQKRMTAAIGDDKQYWQGVGIAMQTAFKKLDLGSPKEYAFHFRAIAAAIK